MQAHSLSAASSLSVGYIYSDEDDSMSMKSGVEQGKYQLIFFTPESLLKRKKYRNIIRSNHYQARIIGLAIDEVHTIKKWLASIINVFIISTDMQGNYLLVKHC